MATVRTSIVQNGSSHRPLAAGEVTQSNRNYVEFTATYIALATDDILVFTGTVTTTLSLPDAATNLGKVYTVINHGTVALTLSKVVRTASATTVNSVAAGSAITFVSSGSATTSYRRIL